MPRSDRPPLHHTLRAVPTAALAAVAAGGVLGSLARYALQLAFPSRPDAFDLATFLANVLGGVCIGALMAVLTETTRHPLLRPFLGIGILGGFTTFSTYVVGVARALDAGEAALAFGYGLATVAAALAAVAAAFYATRLLLRRRRGGAA
ncbi:FluC/FEX family fluoride channel [Glycomyces paridis]|uniref:FluC/FEX family fluoride channel n=1 Tax=Glycomyces paridis TaxID=2126555 RepID=UPI001EFFD4AC|nr:CrcB family protein [Glycomyces paridis]